MKDEGINTILSKSGKDDKVTNIGKIDEEEEGEIQE